MTQRYLGGIITANPVEPSENFQDSAASGMWTMQEALSFSKAGDWPDPTSINPSKFVENVFSTFVYTGTGNSLTINNGIDLSSKGGLVWTKRRNSTNSNWFLDSVRGGANILRSNTTDAQFTSSGLAITSFNSTGYTLGTASDINSTSGDDVSWTFRKQPKFFDVVTYTGDGATDREVSHNLGTTIGFMLVKRTDNTSNWACIAYNGTNYSCLALNSTAAQLFSNATSNFTSTIFKPYEVFQQFTDTPADDRMNVDGASYVAYLFAHNNNDGGFGSTGDQDMIKCGSYTGNGSSTGPEINLGFEPQWIMIKSASGSHPWFVIDEMRGFNAYPQANTLKANATAAEDPAGGRVKPTATGFQIITSSNDYNQDTHTFIYMAIRRGLMKAPTAGTQVFDVQTYTGNGTANRKFTTGFPIDANITTGHAINYRTCLGARLYDAMHETSVTDFSYNQLPNWIDYDHNDGYDLPQAYAYSNQNNYNFSSYSFRRAPGFFDVVAYTGDGSTRNINHNLGVAPEMIILKNRGAGGGGAGWLVGVASLGNDEGALHNDNGFAAYNLITTYSTTTFTAANGDEQINKSGDNYIAYLFATLAGISKVGTYSGTGNDVNVDCGFTNGARFVMVKRTDSSGSWYVWDQGALNGIADSTDPYFLLDSDAARVANTDYIDPLSSGFTITSNAGNDLNQSSGTYLFLAIA